VTRTLHEKNILEKKQGNLRETAIELSNTTVEDARNHDNRGGEGAIHDAAKQVYIITQADFQVARQDGAEENICGVLFVQV
jgi:hypothetical protein